MALARWLATGFAAVMLVFQILVPCVPQFLDYAGRIDGFSSPVLWFENLASSLLVGSIWWNSGREPYLEFSLRAPPVAMVFAATLVMAGLIAGCATMIRKGRPASWLAVIFLLPGMLLITLAFLRGTYLFEWYLAFILPGGAAIFATGFLTCTAACARATKVHLLPIAASAALLAAYFLFSSGPRARFLTRSVQPFRESVLITRNNLNPNAPENRNILTASTLVAPDVYDPRVRKARTLDDCAALIREADERDIPLYMNNGFPAALRDKDAGIHALLTDSAVFEQVAYLHAIEPMLDREVVRYRPGSLPGGDISRYRR